VLMSLTENQISAAPDDDALKRTGRLDHTRAFVPGDNFIVVAMDRNLLGW
jgi:hypothetical protein